MEIRVIRAGMLTTLQDRGRPGLRAAGVPVGGAMDAFALRTANLLVGNPEDAVVLEMTLVGAELEFGDDAVVVLTGAGGEGLEAWRPRTLPAGTRLRIGELSGGCRSCLAVAGGFVVPGVLGGRGTDLRAGWGGWHGRALREGDVLTVGPSACSLRTGDWRMDPRILPAYSPYPVLRVLRGDEADEFGADWLERDYTVRPQSDRMGVRLAGSALVRVGAEELVSTPVAPGTIQVPPDGQLIVLGADAQTIGGYPKLAHVISADLPILAQLRPGDRARFRDVSPAEARRQLQAREKALAILSQGVAEKFR